MEYFKFYNPVKVIFGKGTISQIGSRIASYGYKNALLLYGGGSIKNNGVYNTIVNSLNQNNVNFIEFGGVQPNPILQHANDAVEICKKNNIDVILAAGGGSVIDEAKGIAAGFYQKDVWDIYSGKSKVSKALPIFTVLTLSATGSELNSYSVLTKPEERKKWSFGSPYTYPVVSIIDPEVQNTLPWRQTVNGGVDALSHIMENYFSKGDAEPTLAINEALMRTIIKNINELQENQNDYKARSEFAWTASLALSGLTSVAMNGGEWAVHSIEHSLSAFNPEIAHAEGLAVVFPAWIEYTAKYNSERFLRWSKNVFNKDSINEGIAAFRNLLKKWNAPQTLADLKINSALIPDLAENALEQGMLGNFKLIDYDDVINILKIAC